MDQKMVESLISIHDIFWSFTQGLTEERSLYLFPLKPIISLGYYDKFPIKIWQKSGLLQ